jgi:hypothetical protein
VAGPSAGPLEKLLADQIAGCWLAERYASISLAGSESAGTAVVAVRVRHAESSGRRLLAAVRTMAQVRRLMKGLTIEITHTTAPPAPPPPQALEPAAAGDLDSGEPMPDRLKGLLAAVTRTEALVGA